VNEVLVTPKEGALSIQRAYATHAAFQVESMPPKEGSRAWRIRVSFTPEKWNTDMVSQSLVLDTDSKLELDFCKLRQA
jgi:hypothetical protein